MLQGEEGEEEEEGVGRAVHDHMTSDGGGSESGSGLEFLRV